MVVPEVMAKPGANAGSRPGASAAQAQLATAQPGDVPTDAALVEAARAGQRWAREVLFKRHLGQIRAISRRMLAEREGADDVAQDALVEAVGHLDTLTNPQAFTAWMASIVVRRALKHLRSRQLLRRLGLHSRTPLDLEAVISPSAPAAVLLELRAACAALGRLPEQERMILILRRVEGMRLAEICGRMNLSLATVKRRLTAAENRFAVQARADF
jgi:RNA polymerase sigma-70 factor (ECF subfamily)